MIDKALLDQGQLLCRVDDVAYVALHLVFACDENEAPALYCACDAWDVMPAARLHAKDQEIAALAAKVRALEAQLAAPVANQAAMFRAQAAYLHDAPPAPEADPIVCPDCGKGGWKSEKALQMHRQRAHQGMIAVRHPPAQFVEPLGWRCAASGCAGAHARDMHDPAFCTLHAEPRTNGHAVEVAS